MSAWTGWVLPFLKEHKSDKPEWPVFRLKGGPYDSQVRQIPDDVIADSRAEGKPVSLYESVQDGEVLYQESEPGVLEYVWVRFFD